MSLHTIIGSVKCSLLVLPMACAALVVSPYALAQDSVDDVKPLLEEAAPSDVTEGDISQDENLDFLTGESESGASEEIMSAPQVAPEDVTEVVPVPETGELAAPVDAPEGDVAADGQAGGIPALPVDEAVNENLFFDAESLVPTGEMGRKSGPRKVNPALEPASKLIVVKKNAGGSSHMAQLVSAERALKLGRYEAALEMYNRLYEKNRRDPNILMGRALALQNMDRGEEAILVYQDLLDLRPSNVEAEVNMLGLMGRSYPAVSLQRLMEMREENPSNVSIVSQIAVLEAELGRYNEALQFLGIAASMEPNNANHLFNIAVIADRAGNKVEAISYYEQALEMDSIYGGGRTIPRDSVYERLAQLR